MKTEDNNTVYFAFKDMSVKSPILYYKVTENHVEFLTIYDEWKTSGFKCLTELENDDDFRRITKEELALLL